MLTLRPIYITNCRYYLNKLHTVRVHVRDFYPCTLFATIVYSLKASQTEVVAAANKAGNKLRYFICITYLWSTQERLQELPRKNHLAQKRKHAIDDIHNYVDTFHVNGAIPCISLASYKTKKY